MILTVPAINTTVLLDLAGWQAPLKTRVEELGELLTVADPLVGGDDHEPSLGSLVHVTWEGRRGPSELRASLVGKELRNVRLWHLRPEGKVVITQRRHFARAGSVLPLRLDVAGADVSGHVVDLSEGGMQATCPSGTGLGLRDEVRARFQIDRGEVALACEVVRLEPDADLLQVGCRFLDVPPRQADDIRKFVFDLQMRERRLR